MEAIPEIRENELGIYISRRYQGGFEVSISYAGSYIRRYPLIEITERFLGCVLNHVPILGLWLFSKTKRTEMVRSAYSAAIDEFVVSLKLDVGDAMFAQGDER
jgi:hypothetical protein